MDLENKLSEFVLKTTSGRDKTHGFMHMRTVAQNAKMIMLHMKLTDKQKKYAMIVAWLHDVAVHKYDKDGSLYKAMSDFVHTIENKQNAEYILHCIKSVSFSHEKKNGYRYYEKILPSEWVIVRNIASDADKLEALGNTGISRCSDYAQIKSEKKLTNNEVLQYVWTHAQEKLLLLYKYYINTQNGKLLAKPLHETMIKWFKIQGISENCLAGYR